MYLYLNTGRRVVPTSVIFWSVVNHIIYVCVCDDDDDYDVNDDDDDDV